MGGEHLGKSDGGKAVRRDVTLTVSPGRITCVMAPSGAGKTTLLRILLRLETPDRGVVRVPEDYRWAAVFQEDRLLEQLSARGNLRFALGGAYSEARAAALRAGLGLPETGDQPVREFSGGMRRRLALARALLGPADALALDLVDKGLVTNQLVLTVGYDRENLDDPGRAAQYRGPVTTDRYGRKIPKHAVGTENFPYTSLASDLLRAATALYDRIVDPNLLVRRLSISANKMFP